MKKKTKSILCNILFVLVCFLICALSLIYFFLDLNKTLSRNEKEIAIIQFKERVAQRKFSDSVIWDRLKQKSPLYNEDVVRTESDAEAVIYFNNNAVVDLGSSTMIQVFKEKDGDLKLSVSSGNVEINTKESSSDFKIDLGNGKVVNVNKGSLFGLDSTNGDNTLIVREGIVNIVDNTGEESVVMNGETLKIDKYGNNKKLPITIENISSNQRIFLLEKEIANVNIKMNVSNLDDTEIVCEISDSNGFESVQRKEIIDNFDSYLIPEISDDVYYRIYPDGDLENSVVGKISVERLYKPKIISPKENAVFKNIDITPSIFFEWEINQFSDYCRLEIYDQNDFRNPIFVKDVEGHSITVSSLNEGQYFCKVIPHYSINQIGFAPASDVCYFSIEKIEKVLNPVLKYPLNDLKLVLKKDSSLINFIWESDYDDCQFKIEISDDENFNKIKYESIENSLRKKITASILDFPKGKYFWRVALIDGSKKIYSPSESFFVDEYIPFVSKIIYPPNNFKVEEGMVSKVQFAWSLPNEISEDNAKSIIEISKEENFSSILKTYETNKSSCADVQLLKGIYYWRVKLLDKNSNDVFTKTEINNLIVMDELSKPQIIFPKNNSTQFLNFKSSFNISWNKVDGADYYKLRVYDSSTEKILLKLDSVKDNFVDIPISDELVNVNKEGNIRCTVQAVAKDKIDQMFRISKIDESNFKLRKPVEITLLSPLNGSKIKGVDAFTKPTSFVWEKENSSQKVKFELCRIYYNGNESIIRTIDNPKKKINIKQLSPGNYRWSCYTVSDEGTVIGIKKYNYFTVLKPEKLKNIIPLSPINNFVIDSEYLKKNRKIVFEWEKDSNATDYEFVLYQKDSEGVLKTVLSKKTSSSKVVYTDLQNLDIGNFEWHVTSFVHSRDGTEIQKSDVSKNNFQIYFELPQEVKLREPGRMYGN